jgi:hypothetical protein
MTSTTSNLKLKFAISVISDPWFLTQCFQKLLRHSDLAFFLTNFHLSNSVFNLTTFFDGIISLLTSNPGQIRYLCAILWMHFKWLFKHTPCSGSHTSTMPSYLGSKQYRRLNQILGNSRRMNHRTWIPLNKMMVKHYKGDYSTVPIPHHMPKQQH